MVNELKGSIMAANPRPLAVDTSTGPWINGNDLSRSWGYSKRQIKIFEDDPKDPLPVIRPGGWRKLYLIADLVRWLERRRTFPETAPPPRSPKIKSKRRPLKTVRATKD